MKQLLYYCNHFSKALLFTLLIIFTFSSNLKAQEPIRPSNVQLGIDLPYQYGSFAGNLKTTATATCPTNPVTLAGQNTLGATVTNGQTFACNATPFYIYAPGGSGEINSPCIETEYTNFHTNMGTNGTETFYEGGVDIACIGPSASCAFPIGNGAANNTQWGLILSLLDPTQAHEFVFCRAGAITAGTISFVDCWTGASLPSTPTSTVFSTANPPTTSTCFTMTVAAGTSIGTASFSILPVSAAPAFTDFHDGESYVNTALLGAGTYTVNYSFTPPASSGCGTVNGTFNFTIGPNITASVNSPSVCSGNTATLTASSTGGTGTTTYSWTPSTGLSATTGSVVTVTNPTVTTTYTVTATNGGCTASATSTVNINPTPTITVNSPTICGGGTATLTATGGATYSWTPSTGLSATTGSMVTVTPTVSLTYYTVTGTSSLGCSSSATSTITLSTNPVIVVNSATICAGDSATLMATGATTYTWSPSTGLGSTSTGTVMASPSTLTIYTVTGSIGSCSVTPGTSTVTVNTLPTVSVNSATICAGSVATLTATGANTYSWTPSTGLSATTGSVVASTPIITCSYVVTGTDVNGCKDTATSIVNVNPTPTLTATSATVCVGDSALLTVSGATSYTWNSSSDLHLNMTNDTAKSGASVTETYTVTGSTGICTNTVTVMATVIPVVTITITPSSNPICSGTSATLTATGADTYTWNTTDNTPSIVVTPTMSPTSYTVTGTVGTCPAIPAVITVTVVPTPTLTVKNDTTICSGDMVTLWASGATTYVWADNTSTPIAATATTVVTPTVTQTYYVGGANGSCITTDSVKITVNPLPTLTVTNTGPICSGQQTATLTAIGATNYTWNPSSDLSSNTGTSVTSSATITTTYTALAADANGCMGMGSTMLTVNTPPTITSSSVSVCLGSIATLTVTGASTYTWVPNSALSAPNGTLVTTQPVSTGVITYTIAGTDANGCFGGTTVDLLTNALPTITANTNPASVCVGNTATLTATGANTYTWSPSAGLSSANGTPVSTTATSTTMITYTVNGTDANGCVNSSTTMLMVNPTPNVNAGPDQPICVGDSVHLNATGADTYVWLPAAGLHGATTANPAGAPTSNTTYTVVGTNTLTGCMGVDMIVVSTSSVNPSFTADPETGDAPLDVNFTNTSAGATTYTWNYGNGNPQTTTSLSTQTSYPLAGTYTVTLTASNAAMCVNSVSMVIVVNEGYAMTIPNIFTPNGDGLNDNFFVKSTGVASMSILMYDRWGLKVWEGSSAASMWDGGKSNDGTYFYVIKATDAKGQSHDYKGNVTLVK